MRKKLLLYGGFAHIHESTKYKIKLIKVQKFHTDQNNESCQHNMNQNVLILLYFFLVSTKWEYQVALARMNILFCLFLFQILLVLIFGFDER